MLWLSAPWPTTPTFRGFACTLGAGFVPLCSDRTGAWSNGREAHRKVGSSARC